MFKSKKKKKKGTKHSLNQNIMSQENTTEEHRGVYRIKSIQWFYEKLLSHS
jgi:hypothetical protein